MSHFKGNVMFEDSNNLHAMNEKVQSLANGVYKEFETVIVKFGGDAVKGLMPIVVNILECLDHNIKDKQKNEVDLELSKVEIEHLKNQCDKEKSLRKSADIKYLEMEDLLEESKKQLNQLKNSSDSNTRRLEMKIRNLQDQALRMDEKESKLKDDYSKLHNKYSSLLKSHTEFVQKTNESHHSTQVNQSKNEPEMCKKCLNCSTDAPSSTSLPKSEPRSTASSYEMPQNIFIVTQDSSHSSDISLHSEIAAASNSLLPLFCDDSRSVDSIEIKNEPMKTLEEKASEDQQISHSLPNSSNSLLTQRDMAEIYKEKISKNLDSFDTVSQEGSVAAMDDMYGECLIASNTFACKSTPVDSSSENHLFEIEDDSEALVEISQSTETQNENVKNVSLFEEFSILEEEVGADFVSVGAEVDKLIQENAELLATKNALNVLKDDLIADVEELSGELELTREELTTAQSERQRLDLRINELEEELRKCREEMAQLQSKLEAKEQEVDKTTFSRVELVRILMERNQYKEKWMELQEAVRWAETVRASRVHPELVAAHETKRSKTSAVWGFFNSFLGREKDENWSFFIIINIYFCYVFNLWTLFWFVK